ncbi:MAG TPA: glycosyltransferase [Rhizomicrobium sp.]|nr:glycosyltransferase [Rhizomicrobium sp.]
MKKAGPRPGSNRIPPGFSAKLALVNKVIRRRILLDRLRWIARRSDWRGADRMFQRIAAPLMDDAAAAEILSGATLRGARDAEARGRFTIASRFWVWHAAASGDVQKASRNLARCARLFTKERLDSASISGALQAWRLLAVMDPQSGEARHGQAWCHAALARVAEQEADHAMAQAEWSAALQLLPNDLTALEGLRRTLEANPGQLGADPRARVQALYQQLVRETRPDYGSQCAAASLLLNAATPDLAFGFIETSLSKGKRPEAMLLLFRYYAALDRHEDAAATLVELTEGANKIPAIPTRELRTVLAHAPPNIFSARSLSKLALAENAQRIAPVLVSYAVDRAFPDVLIALSNNFEPDEEWSIDTALAAADTLWKMGEQLRALRILAPFSSVEPVASRFASYAQAFDFDRVEPDSFQDSAQNPGFSDGCLLMAEIYLGRGDVVHAANALCRSSEAAERSEAFYRTHKSRIALLIEALLRAEDQNFKIRRDLASLVALWVSEGARNFYKSQEFSDLYDMLAAAARFAVAPPTSRLGLLREHYFEHHMERREERDPETFDSEFGFCETAFRYFGNIAAMRPVEKLPVGTALKARLGKPTLSLGDNRFADLSMTYAVLKRQPSCDLTSSELFETLANWYIRDFMPANKIPSTCLPPDVAAHFNDAVQDHSGTDVVATRFAYFMQQQSEVYKNRYDLNNSVDTLLFGLELIAVLFRSAHQYRPFIAAIVPPRGGERTFADLCVAALLPSRGNSTAEPMLSSVLNYRATDSSDRTLSRKEEVPQDVLLIGHGGPGTGLGRNFQMFMEALSGADISLTSLAYETEADSFAKQLRDWYGRCRTPPIVIAAVNAQDVPALFIKDRYDLLDKCHVAGFFLWETSRAPRVQHLGIRLVDEIWAPTNYVANVYRPFAPVHVVGKGLFSAAEPAAAGRSSGAPIRFLTIFDFHSSIERKNPLAVVLAFQKAFAANESVELVVKASNVNPQHPGNASGQWERLCGASAGDRRIRIITDRYTEEQMRQLMRGTSCVVSLHRSEGFGYVLSDAMALGIPVIATDYSGNVDFCDSETSYPVSCSPVAVVSHGAHWESEGTQWAEPDIRSAAEQMQAVYSNYSEALRKSTFGRERILEKYSKEAFAARLQERLAAIRASSHTNHPIQAAQ